MKKILEYAKNINDINNNKYCLYLSDTPSLDKFLLSQESFIYGIDNWSKLLGLMIFYVPSVTERNTLIKNLYDEHGDGDINKSHVNTFKTLLSSLGYNREFNTNDPSYQYIKNFNEQLINNIKSKNQIFSIAMLGMIEFTYTSISKNIHQYLCNFLPKENINHYSCHEVLDASHSEELFELLVPYQDTNINDISEDIKEGYQIIFELYNKLSTFLQPTTTSL
jgi:hypothetical protein